MGAPLVHPNSNSAFGLMHSTLAKPPRWYERGAPTARGSCNNTQGVSTAAVRHSVIYLNVLDLLSLLQVIVEVKAMKMMMKMVMEMVMEIVMEIVMVMVMVKSARAVVTRCT